MQITSLLHYEYEVTNSGNVTITSAISVDDDLIPSVSCPALPTGGLIPGDSILCTGDYAVDQQDIDDGSVTNTADATDGTTTSPEDSVTVNATQLPALSLTKTADPIDPVDFVIGATANYTYVVTNSGNTTIVDPITVNDNRIPSVSCDALPTGGLLPTQSINCTGAYVVDANDVALFEVTNLATATDGNVTSAQVSETIPLGGVPSLSLAKTAAVGSSFAALGDTITYSFEVTNDGTVSFATPITITDNTIPGSPIACYTPTPANPDLIPGESFSCTGTFTYSVDQDDLDAGVVINEATANTTFMGTTPVVSSPATETVDAATNPSIAVSKSADPNTFTTVGETIEYTISVNNDGNQTLTNVMVSDPLIPSLMCVVPTLTVGATDNSCVGNYTVDQDDIDLGRIDNVANASATTPQGTTINGSGNLTINGPVAAPSVEVTKAASPSPFGGEGSLINYTFAVRNTGNVRLSNIIVTDPIDAGFSCTIASLNPNAIDATTCSLNYTVLQDDVNAGSITNEVSVVATSADPSGQSVNDTDQIITPGPTRNPAIEIEKIANTSGLSSPVQVGDIISYSFNITNTGNVTLTNIDVTDSDATVAGLPITTLEPGVTDTTTFTATRSIDQDDINNGSFANQADVTADTPVGLPSISEPSDDPSTPADDDATVVTLPAAPQLEITKTGVFNDGGNGRPDVGDTITYTFIVQNTGNVTLSNVSVTDPLVTVTPAAPILLLEPGVANAVTLSATYTLLQSDINRGEVLNQALASGTAPDGSTVEDDSDDPADTTGNDDPTIIPLAQEASIELEKVATLIDGGDGVDEGDTIEYAFTVTNTGNLPLSGVTITDPLVAVSGGPITLFPGVTNTTSFTAVYTITQQDIDDGFFTNTATVNGTGPNGEAASDVSDDPADGTGNDDPTTVNFVQTPSLALEKVDDISGFSTPPVEGDTITYSFRIENTGNVTLTNVVVDDPLVNVTGTPVTLLPGEVDTTTYEATYQITQDDIDAGTFSNSATVAGNPPTGPPVSDTSDDPSNPAGEDDPTVTTIQQAPAMTVEKNATIVNFVNVGDTVTYEYLVTNSGNTSITAPITITDNLITNPADISCPALPAGGLSPTAPNNTITCTGTYTVVQEDLERGTVTNLASASDGTTTSPSVSETIPDGQPAALMIEKSTTNAPFTAVGEVITYSYIITNNGGRTLTGTTEVIDDRISGPISCFTGNLVPAPAAGSSQTCTAQYTITQADLDAGSVTNEAFAENDNVTAVGTVTSPPDSVTLDAVQSPAITVEKVGTPNFNSPVQVGDTIDYAFTITNTGNVTLTNVIVEDDGVVLTGSPIATLAPFDPTAVTQTNVDSTTYTAMRVLTQEDIDAGQFENQASVRATDPNGVETENDSDDPAVGGAQDPTIVPIPQNPSIEIEKTAVLDDFGDGTIEVGDEILYSFRIVNNGNVSLSEIFVTDSNATITSDDVIVNPSATNGSISLAPAEEDTTTFVGVHVITLDDLNAGTFANQASVTATTPDSGTINEPSDDPVTTGTDDDPTVVTLPQNPSITITKVGTVDDGGDGSVDEGDVINYTFRIENTGNVTLTNIMVTDTGADVSAGTLASLAPDTVDTDTFTAQHVLTQLEIDSGSYSNQASVEGTPFAGGAPVSDLSDDPFDSTSEDDPTVTTLGRTAALTTRKISGVASGLAADGTFTQVFSIEVENTGNTTITNPTLIDNLESVFGLAFDPSSATTTTSGITVAPSISADAGNTGTSPIANVSYDGDASSGLLDGSSGSLAPGDIITVTFTALFDSTQISGTLVNSATASGTPPTGTTLDTTDTTDTSDVVGPVAEGELGLVKTSVLDLTGGASATVLDAGDTINYTYTVTNTSSTLNALNIVVSEAGGAAFTGTNGAPTPIAANDGTTIDATGATNDLAPNATLTWTASYILSQEDINAGQVDNSATVAGVDPFGNDLSDTSDEASNGSGTGNDDPTVTTLAAVPSMDIEKSLTSVTQVFPFIYDIVYEVTVENTGNVTLTNLQVEDDLSAALAPASVISTDLTVSGFTGTGGENTSYNGVAQTQLLVGDVQLNPTNSGTIIITARVDFSAGFPSQGNTATATSDMISVPVPSNDPSVTPGDDTDTNPTPPPLEDADNDGAPDTAESSTNDRDGDGIPDAQDYDPTGYFYCQETARILPGGFISCLLYTSPSPRDRG